MAKGEGNKPGQAAHDLASAALGYAARGWPVLPLHTVREGRCTCGQENCSSAGKHPRTTHGLKDATTDEQAMRQWWAKWPDANIGIVTGAESGLVVLDVDPRHGGEFALEGLVPKHERLPDTVESQTGGGGRHIFFRHPGGPIKSKAGALGPGLDIKGDGGYIVAPPSLHVSGQHYVWEAASDPADVEIAELPAWLLSLLQDEDAPRATAASQDDQRIPEGRRNETLTSVAGSMRRRGMAEATILAALQEENRQRCDPPLDEAEVAAVAKSVMRYEPAAPAAGAVLSNRTPLLSAREYLRRQYAVESWPTLRYYAELFYAWQDNTYAERELQQIRAELYHFLDGAVQQGRGGDADTPTPFSPDKKDVDFVLDALKAETFLSALRTPPVWLVDEADLPPALELLPCRSHLLHLPTMRQLPPTPKLFSTNALSIDYDPDAPSPEQWLAFLVQLWPDDRDSIATLQQWFGYCLTPDARQQKMLLLVGPKRSGKGTIGRVLGSMLGHANVAAPTASSLANQFGLQPLIGKSLAIVSDARLSDRTKSSVILERLLSISGEDLLNVQRKNLPDVTLRLPTRFMFLSNELPQFSDSSGALASRFIILRLTESFYGHEDLYLTDKLLPELPGILKWAVGGWRQLQQAEKFLQPESGAAAARELEDLASPTGAFIRERCRVGPEYSVGVQALYRAWKEWCEVHGRKHPGTDATFGRNLQATLPHVRKTRPRDDAGGRTWLYSGIGLRVPPGPGRSMDRPGSGRDHAGTGGRDDGPGGGRPGPGTSLDRPAADGDEVPF